MQGTILHHRLTGRGRASDTRLELGSIPRCCTSPTREQASYAPSASHEWLPLRYVAQWTERGVSTARGEGSTPSVPSILSGSSSGQDVALSRRERGFDSRTGLHLASVAQWTERWASNPSVARSNRAGGSIQVVVAEKQGAGLQTPIRWCDSSRRLHPRVAQSGERPVYTRRHALERSQPWGPSC